MKENSLAAVCVMTALVGIASLFVLSKSIQPEETSIDSLNHGDVGRYVVVKSRVSSVSDYGSNMKIKLCSKYCVNVVIWRDVAREIEERSFNLSSLRPGQVVEARGIVKEWNNALELVAQDWRSVEVIGT
jgi:DNA/RNA endonuclease YhcR with UshA esterase domain